MAGQDGGYPMSGVVLGEGFVQLKLLRYCRIAEYVLLGFNPLPTLGNSLKEQDSLYKVLMASIKPNI